MTDLSNPSPPAGNDHDPEENHSPASMVFSMLLLITVLLLTSVLLIQNTDSNQVFDKASAFNLREWMDRHMPRQETKIPVPAQKAAVSAAPVAQQPKPVETKAPAPVQPPKSGMAKVAAVEPLVEQAPAEPAEKPDAGKTASTLESLSSSLREFKKFLDTDIDGSVRWPKLKLTGFGTSKDADGNFAIINGQPVLLNHYIDDVQVVEIRSQDVVVEYKGERRTLSVLLQSSEK